MITHVAGQGSALAQTALSRPPTDLDGHRDALHQFGELQLLLLADADVAELAGEAEHAEQLDLGEGRLQQLVVGLHRLVGQVEVAGDPAQLRHLTQGGGGSSGVLEGQ